MFSFLLSFDPFYVNAVCICDSHRLQSALCAPLGPGPCLLSCFAYREIIGRIYLARSRAPTAAFRQLITFGVGFCGRSLSFKFYKRFHRTCHLNNRRIAFNGRLNKTVLSSAGSSVACRSRGEARCVGAARSARIHRQKRNRTE